MRTYVLYIAIFALAIYAWRDWFISLCGLIALTALTEHIDMPRNMMGIQGMNPWNALMASILIPWLIQRHQERTRFDIPLPALAVLGAYLLLIVVSYVRAVTDLDSIPSNAGVDNSFVGFTVDHLVNPLKFILPAVLLADGCRTRKRMVLALCAILLMAVLHAIVILRSVPLGSLRGDDFMQFRNVINKRTGLHANAVVNIFVMSFWGLVALRSVWKRPIIRAATLGVACMVGLCIPLCQSRAGFAAFVAVTLVLGVLRWRMLLVMMIPAAFLISIAMPSIPARLGMGVGSGTAETVGGNDWDVITAGRTSTMWPAALEQIAASPLIGHGRRALLRTSAYDKVADSEGECPNHPHNAYLEVLMDAGIVGLIPVILLLGSVGLMSATLLGKGNDVLFQCAGVLGLSATVALAVSSASSEGLFPKVGLVGFWCAWAIVLRAWMVRKSKRARRPNAASVLVPMRRRMPAKA